MTRLQERRPSRRPRGERKHPSFLRLQRVAATGNGDRWISVRVEKVSASGVSGALKKAGSMEIYTTKVSVEGECESERH
jgi:hypothetical protein